MVTLKAEGTIRCDGAALAFDWSVRARAKHADQPSGDCHVIMRQDQLVLFAVADGSGSGAKAAWAAQQCLTGLAVPEGRLDDAFRLSHVRLRGGRGAAMALLAVDPYSGWLSWAAVGDVDAVLLRDEQGRRSHLASVVQIAGTLGITFDRIAPDSHLLGPGDLMVVSTDGVSRDLDLRASAALSADEIAERVLHDHGRVSDDCLVMTIAVVAGP